MKVGSGNVLLYWGYFTVPLIGRDIPPLILCTQNYIWSWDGCSCLLSDQLFHISKEVVEPAVVTYTDKTISKVWQVFGCMFD